MEFENFIGFPSKWWKMEYDIIIIPQAGVSLSILSFLAFFWFYIMSLSLDFMTVMVSLSDAD